MKKVSNIKLSKEKKQFKTDSVDVLLTKHAMHLSSTSLAEDWSNEEDDYWESFLKREIDKKN
ncbi:hypothetical protein [Mongoliitalea daihaiensis]|uniref:hypothetical protein n=1 Tax=Mongoliitalea daihaiensis TaxID=2782006 RepID=UPI001F16F8BC|nr:hypothetical protein [Mongoliitalea daihaiensis]UJP64452.1 hypothetical protein IPZ59_16840 [Mongoliitalea daihaiensis]